MPLVSDMQQLLPLATTIRARDRQSNSKILQDKATGKVVGSAFVKLAPANYYASTGKRRVNPCNGISDRTALAIEPEVQ
ncbi:hypothetical protein HaLaN_16355, partial [Haematococcus lacustris]